MRSAIQLLAHLRDLGVRVSAAGDKLKIRGARDVLTLELREQLGEHNRELLELLESEHRQELLELLESQESEATVPLARVSREGPLVLSFGQERLRFLDQLIPNNASYNTPSAIRLGGELDRSALAQSLDGLAERHESLRTTFSDGADGPVQRIAPPAPVALAFEDLCGLPAAQRQAELESRLLRVAQEPFDLGAGPLFRVVLYRLGEQDHVLLLLFHHIVIDGWSLGVIHHELGQLYAAAREGRAPELPELPVQFADYAAWQRASLTGEVVDRHLEFWRKALAGWSALELPTDRPRPPVQRFRGARWRLTLPASLTSALEDAAREAEVTPFMLLLAAFQSLLGRYSGQDDVVVGSPIAGRNRVELEGLVGFLVNTLLLRGDLSGDPSFRELLGRVKKATLAAYRHQELPFEVLVHELAPERDLSRNPLFQVLFTVQNAPADSVELPGLSVRSVEFEDSGSILDLSVIVWTGNEGLEIDFTYDTDLYDLATVERMGGHLRTLLEGVAADAGSRLSELDLLREEERQTLLVEWNRTEADYPDESCLHEQFERRVAATPDAVALSFEDTTLTYGELNARANRLAHYLGARGVGPEVLVGLCLERTPELVVAILGILKAGGGYVPIDLANPAERIAFILGDTAVPVLVTASDHLEQLPEHSAEVVLVDGDREAIGGQSPENPAAGATPENVAYVIYTSGSTGEPKGVLVEHGTVTRLFPATQEWFGFSADDVWTLFHSCAFDFSVWEMWGALLYGGRLVVVPYWISRSPEKFHELLIREGVTVLNQTPSAFRGLMNVDAERPGAELALRLLIFGGEALDLQSLRPWFEHHGDERPQVVNMYGITETTVHVTYRRIRAADLDEATGSVIGRPIPDLRVYVLDENMEPVPIGVPGELYVGGAGVARGYLDRAQLTAQRFVVDPHRPEADARLYRTGDVGRWLATRELEYVGRNDEQVKVRGFRIELGEIDAALARLDAVRDAVTLCREDQPGEKALVAYLVPAGEARPSPAELRAELGGHLPYYMLPAAHVYLDELPLNANGKVDRRALPAAGAVADEDSFVEPQNDTEATLCSILAELLGVERVSRDASFFDFGGHSLLAMQVISRVRASLDVEVSLQSFFEDPTVAGLGKQILVAHSLKAQVRKDDGELLESQESEATVPLARVSREEPLVLSFGQERLRFLDQLIPTKASYNTASAIRLGGELDRSALTQVLDGLAARHESLRTTFSDGADGPVQRIAPPAPVALAFEDLCGLPAAQRQAELESRLQRVAQEPFDLGAGPLFRVVLYRLGEQDHVLLLLFHHIVIDGWSLGVIHRELGQLYAAAREGRAPELPELPVQFADYAAWQRASLTGEVLDRHLEFWRKALAGWSALELPTDRPRPPVQRFRGARWRLTLPASLSSALEDVAREAEVTPFMLLLATFQSLLGRYSGQDDVVVGSPIAGRNRVELEGLVGFLVNTLVLRGDLSGDPSFRELLGRVKKATLAAYQHQELPFEVLVHELAPERDLSRNPLFQVLFTVQNAPADSVELPGLSVRTVEFEDSGSILDLSVVVWTGNEGLEIEFIYNTDLFEAATVRSLARAFTSVLEQVVEDPDRRLSELALLDPEAQREALELQRWTPAEPGPEALLHGLFARQAARTPEALAVSQADAALTYGELADRAAALARHLRGRGVGPGTLVGVCLHRSPDMLVALLGILEAGGAYVPLDPTMPAERLRYVLEDTGAPLVLTESRCAAELPELGERLLRLDEPLPAEASLAPADPEGPRHPVGPGDLAYVIHTSGSTGRPKGVQLTHASVVNFMESMAREPGLGSDDVLLAVTILTFDIAALELFLPLCVGARVEVAPREVVSDGRFLAQALSACGATAMQATPAMWQMLLQAGWRGDGLLKMLCGGEELPRSLARELLERGGELWNMYGPTETTIWSAVHRVRAEDLAEPTEGTPGGGAVTLGEPIAETRLLVLDERRRPVPPGVAGELHIAGAGLARGYLNRTELDAEKFVPSPWPELLPGRLCRTGDAVCIDAAGRLRFLGRIDNQIKLRGFRIEPGEIEAVLREHPSVRQAVVVVREEAPGDRRLVAYLVPRGEAAPAPGELREHLRRKVPDYMVPGAFVALDELPLSPAGKVDRRALPAPGGERNVVEEFIPPRSDFEARVAEIWCEVLGVERVGVHDNFFDLGGHSMLVGIVRNRIAETLGRELSMVDFFQFPTVADLAAHIGGPPVTEGAGERPLRAAARERVERRRELARDSDGVAIVGLACRFPGAPDAKRFWENLRDGVESIRFFTTEELRGAGVAEELLGDPSFVPAKGFLAGADLFDAGFFGYSPREASQIDPQQRVFLECAWQALEGAGYDALRYDGRIGVYAGESQGTYEDNLRSHTELSSGAGGVIPTFNDKDFLANRVSYKLNLRGPALTVQTACSTSLVAVHQACQSLLMDECTMAVAGGVSVTLPLMNGYRHLKGGILSKDGHCRPFDAQSSGTIAGDGVGVVVLKRLADAVADGDTIHAVIRGSAVNNDGSQKIGYTATSIDAQSEVVATAQALAGVEADSIGYLEAHGTATELGDPIEVAALQRVFRESTDKRGFCGIGSLKSNIGHLDAAAGIGGLIKTVLTLQHGVIPPSLHYCEPNPEIDLDESPFFVPTEPTEWPACAGPRRAGVSSFGIGGTNAHVVLEQAPRQVPSGESRDVQLLTVSARTPAALDQACNELAASIEARPELVLADVAYTLQVGRQRFRHRRAIVCRDSAEAASNLSAEGPQRIREVARDPGNRSVIFLFSGQGAQYPDMGRGLYESEATFREVVDHCSAVLEPELGLHLREVLFPGPGDAQEAADRIQRTELTQPALFVVEYALARLWSSWGILPDAMIGHSIGEYVAACLAGEIGLEDALRLVAIRGRLMGGLPSGSMLAVSKPADELVGSLPAGVSVAVVNGPDRCVVSGEHQRVAAFAEELAAQGVVTRELRTSHAFHSSMMEPILEEFGREVARFEFQPPAIPYVSNLTGTWKTKAEASDPEYWVRHLRSTVHFHAGLEAIFAREGDAVILEVGPGDTLAGLAKRHPLRTSDHAVLTSLRHPKQACSDAEFVMETLGRLWLEGLNPDWQALHGASARRRVPLPTYPFERQRYWIERSEESAVQVGATAGARRADLADWFYLPSWRRSFAPVPRRTDDDGAQPGTCLLLAGEGQLVEFLAEGLAAAGRDVVLVRAGVAFERRSTGFVVDPQAPEDYARALRELDAEGRAPNSIVHLWCATQGQAPRTERGAEHTIALGFHALVYLAQALSALEHSQSVRIDVVTDGVHEVLGGEPLDPEKATLLGPCRVIPLEFGNVTCRNIDLSTAADPLQGGDAELVLQELLASAAEPVVAYRGRRRWVEAFGPARMEPESDVGATRLRQGGTYLITGGLGGMALQFASYLAQAASAKLVLVTRTALPERELWTEYVRSHGADDPMSGRILAVEGVEAAGGEVLLVQADVAQLDSMRAAVQVARLRFGGIDGVIHTAGVAGGGVIQLKGREEAERVLAPKVLGARVLEQLFGTEELDFLVLCSSLNSVIGAPGQVDDCAANAFLDAFARRFATDTGIHTVSVDWNVWREVGMSVNVELPAGRRAHRQAELAHSGLSNREGVEVFRRILDRDTGPQVLISATELEGLTGAHSRGEAAQGSTAAPEPESAALSAHYRSTLSTNFVAPSNELEQALAEIWQRLLGTAGVGVHDSFFELGGDSLLGIELVARAQEAGLEMSPQAIFEHPTIAELAQILQNTASSPAEFGADGEESTASRVPPIVPAARDRNLPLSFAQQRLWFLDQLGVGAAYNLPDAYRISGELDPAVLEMALCRLVRRHEALRTRFEVVAGQPVQRISDDVGIELHRIDLRELPEEDRKEEIERLIRLESDSTFDLARGPLLRAGLVHLAEHEHLLIVGMHHIVSDGWSMDVFFRDLSELFAACREGREPDLPELAIQYTDFAVWQRGWMHDEALEDQLVYWREQLAGVEVLNMPTDRPRPAIQTFVGAAHRFELEPELGQAILSLSRQKGLTPFMTVFAAFQALLQRYTGQDDIAVGSAIAGRTRPEIEHLIGFFVNALVLRTDLSGDPTFEELLERVRDVALSAYRYQDLPFERLVDEVDPERDLAHSPLFQVAFVYNAPRSRMELSGLGVSPFPARITQARYDMEVFVTELPEHFACTIVYNTDLFDASTIERFGRHFNRLLESAVTTPAGKLSDLKLLDQEERQTLLCLVVDWNLTATDYPRERRVHELFEEQVARAPEALALEFGDRELSYRELDERADRLAAALRDRGVGRGSPVAVCLERGLEFVVSALAVLKAGGAYVPLDPELPEKRLALLLEDTGAAVLIAAGDAGSTPPGFAGEVLGPDALGPIPGAPPTTQPGEAGDLAYVIYTSGSTGTPKGVAVPHRAVVRLVRDTDYVDLGPGDRVAQASIVSFDAATFEIWGALLNGAALVGLPVEIVLEPARLAAALRERRINTLFVTTALFNQLVAARADVFADLRYCLFGGEACDPASVRTALERGAPQHLLHVYGPTENTTFSTWHRVLEVPEGARTVPIGRPIANSTAYVLDPSGRPSPVGVPGELFLGGDGLARGYLDAPELTAERFVPHPFDPDPEARLYRTGDLARFLKDGALEFVARIDHQLKIRGHRIEPGEIEAVLLGSPAVREAIVIAREDTPGDKRLVAYLVPEDVDLDLAALPRTLRELLPGYMVPAAFVPLEALPLTPNGKVDRRALPAPGAREAGVDTVAPRGETEVGLARIWSELLNVEGVGSRNNFFELGGHSLLATQLTSRIRDEFEVELPLRSLFEEPTVAGLAALIHLLRSSRAGTSPRVRENEDEVVEL